MSDARPTSAPKYVPRPELLNLAWNRHAVETGAVPLQRCDDCGQHRHPPRRYCPACFSAAWRFVSAEGGGTLYSFTISHRSADPGWAGEVPYATLVIELDEGPRLVGAARGFDLADLAIGMRVRALVERRSEDFAFLWVEPER